MANPDNQDERRANAHGGEEQGLDPGLDAYAHSADQSMGYLETEQQGQTEDYGDEPYGAYERGGAMYAGDDRYSPADNSEQTRLPDLSGQPGAGPWATEPPGTQVPGAGEQAMPAEYAAWHPPAVSKPGASAYPEQPTADELRARELRQTIEMRSVPPNPNVHSGAPLPPEVVEQQGQPPRPGIYAGQQQITGTPGGHGDTRSGEALLASANGDTGQANPSPPPEVDTDAPTTEQANREHGAPLGPVPGTGENADGGEAGEPHPPAEARQASPLHAAGQGGAGGVGASGGRSPASRGKPAVVGEGEPEVASRRAPIAGEAAGQGQVPTPRIQPTPPGGNKAAEQVLKRDTQQMEHQEQQQQQQKAQPGAEKQGQSSGRTQPAGTVMPTDKHAEAMRDARTRIQDAIDQLASQIPYGEEFAQQAKAAADTALDRLEAQALQRQDELRRDLHATP